MAQHTVVEADDMGERPDGAPHFEKDSHPGAVQERRLGL